MFINKRKKTFLILVPLLMSLFLAPCILASPAEDSMDLIGSYLASNQEVDGSWLDPWPAPLDLTGSIVIGMVEAYRHTCDSDYKTSALLGGEFVKDVNPDGYYGYGHDALALAMLSTISNDPQNNQWRTELEDFYEGIRNPANFGGTQEWLDLFVVYEPSNAVVHLAHHALASDYVSAVDKDLYREAVRDYLSRTDDNTGDGGSGEYSNPVMALGAALWALAQTGPLDNSFVAPGGTGGRPYWDGQRLNDLPGLLLGHQQSAGPSENQGSFFWRFDHDLPAGSIITPTYGFTEDAIFAILGLTAAQEADPSQDYSEEIDSARTELLDGIQLDGSVLGHLWATSPEWYLYGGEMLMALDGSSVDGDLNMDGKVNMEDILLMSQNWLSYCSNADINKDGIVNLIDFALLYTNWLYGTP